MAPLEPESAKRTVTSSRFLIAVLLFMTISGAACANAWGLVPPERFPYLSWTAWTIKDLIERKQAPDIVLLGSSLMLVPLDGVDADYIGHRLDGSQHHFSAYIEDRLYTKTRKHLSTFNFALPGEMPSDAFLIGDNLLKGAHRPKVIVYGVGPRDFLDNMLPSPAATDPFRFLSRFGNLAPLSARVFPGWEERLNFELGQLVYFYGKRIDLVKQANDWTTARLSTLVPLPPGGRAITRDERHFLMPDYMSTELHKGDAFFRPSTPAEQAKFSDNLDEYRKRYKKLKPETFNSQMGFFQDLLAVSRSRGIHAIVVAMPITDLNRSLLSDANWNLYRSRVQQAARENGASFVDFSEDKTFVRKDFLDTVHLHSGGGKKLLDLIVQAIASDADARTALALPDATPQARQHLTTAEAPVNTAITDKKKLAGGKGGAL